MLENAKKQRQLAELYAEAQRLHEGEEWRAVVRAFEQIAAIEPEYDDPGELLAIARKGVEAQERQMEVEDLYGRAAQAVGSGQWLEAERLLRKVQEREPGYRETKRLLAKAEAEIKREQQKQAERQRQEQVARLYEEAQDLARTGQWRQALAKMGQLRALDSQFPDPQEIAARAQVEMDREEAEARRQKEMAALYAEAVRLLRAGQYQAALDRWEQVRARDPQYPDQDRVQATVGQRLAAPAEAAPPKRKVASGVQPKQAKLPAWFWPAAGGTVVLLVVVVIALNAILGGGNGPETQVPGLTSTMAALPTASAPLQTDILTSTATLAPTAIATDTLQPTATLAPTAIAADTLQPTATLAPTATPTPKPTPQAGATRVWPQDDSVMVYVPAGAFWMGSDESDPEADADEKPQHQIAVDAFWIDRTEVTNGQYQRCVEDGACRHPARTTSHTGESYYENPDFDDYPVIFVVWEDASVYCAWAGKRLPSEAEWEKAARGTDKRAYPWGDTFDGNLLNFCDVNCEQYYKAEDWDDGYAYTAPVESYEAGAAPSARWIWLAT